MTFHGYSLFKAMMMKVQDDLVVKKSSIYLECRANKVPLTMINRLTESLLKQEKIKLVFEDALNSDNNKYQLDMKTFIWVSQNIIFWENIRKSKRFKQAKKKAKDLEMGNIYLFQCSGTNVLKIGWTRNDPKTRRTEIQTSNPHRIEVLSSFSGTIKQEKELQRHFAKFNTYGEWFQYSEEIVQYFKERSAKEAS